MFLFRINQVDTLLATFYFSFSETERKQKE